MNETIFLEELKELVALESFSRDAVGTGKVAAWIKKTSGCGSLADQTDFCR